MIPLVVRRAALVLACLLVLLLPAVLLAADPSSAGVVPAPAPAAPAPATSSWLSPEGLQIALIFVTFVVMPVTAGIARRLGFNTAADAVDAATKDAQAYRGALVSVVQGVERARKRTSFEIGKDIAKAIEGKAGEDGTGKVVAAVVEAVTKPGASVPSPTVAAAAPSIDPVAVAVRTATGRLSGGPAAGVA